MLKKICFSCQINLTIGERPNKKNIESLNLTRKVDLLRLGRGKLFFWSFCNNTLHTHTYPHFFTRISVPQGLNNY